MKWWAGTSGFSYKEWKGTFYPSDLVSTKWLRYYASQLSAVEINNTFYRFPKKSILEGWAEQVPAGFRFVLKAPKKITHIMRLRDAEQEVKDFCAASEALGDKLGAILFQLPPNLPCDLERFKIFLEAIPKSSPSAFEFRHNSWFDESVFRLLREHNRALCIADTDDLTDDPKLISTADFGYLRLRRVAYREDEIARWHAEIEKTNWKQVFVFLKHEDGAIGPKLARSFL